jgi:hypothetical protein
MLFPSGILHYRNIGWGLAYAVVILAGLISVPSLADDSTGFVVQSLGSQALKIPNDIIEMVYRGDTGTPKPVNGSQASVIRLLVQWPDFGAVSETKKPELFLRRIHISLLSLDNYPIVPVDVVIENLAKQGIRPRVIDGGYGLQELRIDLPNWPRQYVALIEGDKKILIVCNNLPPGGGELAYSCDSKFAWKDINVDLYFTSLVLPQWSELFAKTRTLLDAMEGGNK